MSQLELDAGWLEQFRWRVASHLTTCLISSVVNWSDMLSISCRDGHLASWANIWLREWNPCCFEHQCDRYHSRIVLKPLISRDQCSRPFYCRKLAGMTSQRTTLAKSWVEFRQIQWLYEVRHKSRASMNASIDRACIDWSSTAEILAGAVGDQVGVLVQNASTVIAAYIIAFVSRYAEFEYDSWW